MKLYGKNKTRSTSMKLSQNNRYHRKVWYEPQLLFSQYNSCNDKSILNVFISNASQKSQRSRALRWSSFTKTWAASLVLTYTRNFKKLNSNVMSIAATERQDMLPAYYNQLSMLSITKYVVSSVACAISIHVFHSFHPWFCYVDVIYIITISIVPQYPCKLFKNNKSKRASLCFSCLLLIES